MKTILNHGTELILLLFLVIVFLQSGLDKLFDWKGNLSWLTSHFSATPFKNSVPLLLGVILVLEVLTGLFSLAGIVELLSTRNDFFATLGAFLACISLLMLLLGQRIAKDYDGAKTITIYLVPAVFLLFLLQF